MSGQISIAISTSSTQMNWPNLPPLQYPTMTVGGLAIPPYSDTGFPNGFWLVVFDVTKDIPTPASFLVNECFGIPQDGSGSWALLYDSMYASIVTTLLSAGNPANQLVILASYGLDMDMAPDNDAYALLLSYGAGPQLQEWVSGCDPGSMSAWVGIPANYLFVGFGGAGYGGGSEIYQQSFPSVSSSLNLALSPDTRELRPA